MSLGNRYTPSREHNEHGIVALTELTPFDASGWTEWAKQGLRP